MMDHSELNKLNQLARRGIWHLFLRQVFTTAITFAGSIVLARILSPADFGTYAIITFVVNMFMVCGDLGLSASFIQHAAPPSQKRLQAAFTIQFVLVTAVVLLTWIISPWMMSLYASIGDKGVWLARTLSLSLYIPVFRSLSAAQLERAMDYRRLGSMEAVGIFLYQAMAVLGAIKGLGAWSFVLGTFVSGIAGIVIIRSYAPWPIRFCLDWTEMRRILGYGISFQFIKVTDAISHWVTPVVVGMLIGPEAVGFLGLALANARRPMMLADSAMRVSFPHFSRMQEKPKELQQTMNDYIVGFLWVAFMWVGFLWVAGSPAIAVIYSAKWLPAVPPLMILAAVLPFEVIVSSLGVCFRAVNRNWIVVRIFSVGTLLNVMLAILLVPRIGFAGVAWAYVASNLLCAGLLLHSFAPGCLQRLVRSCWWMIPSLAGAYACGHLSMDLFIRGGGSNLVLQVLAGTAPLVLTYVLMSLALAPARYRDWFLDLVQRAITSRSGRSEDLATVITPDRRGFRTVSTSENFECGDLRSQEQL